MKEIKTSLVAQGGGFRTAFTAGVLDTFSLCNHNNFDHYIGVSAGAVAISYFLADQYRAHFEAAHHMIKDPDFLNVRNALSQKGYMNIDHIKTIAKDICHFNIDLALTKLSNAKVEFVVTNIKSGNAEYLSPSKEDWLDLVIASSTLPFVTKGKHLFEGKELMDGGWSDPLPVIRAHQQGANKIIVIGTLPKAKIEQNWPDYLASLYYRKDETKLKVFGKNHEAYNESLDFIHNPPKNVQIDFLAPSKSLQSGNYNKSKQSLLNDYRHGMHIAMDYLNKQG